MHGAFLKKYPIQVLAMIFIEVKEVSKACIKRDRLPSGV